MRKILVVLILFFSASLCASAINEVAESIGAYAYYDFGIYGRGVEIGWVEDGKPDSSKISFKYGALYYSAHTNIEDHITHCIIKIMDTELGIAPDANVRLYAPSDASGSNVCEKIANSVESVSNIDLGGGKGFDIIGTSSGNTPALSYDAKIQNAYNNGCLVVAAGGQGTDYYNDPKMNVIFPASSTVTLGVGFADIRTTDSGTMLFDAAVALSSYFNEYSGSYEKPNLCAWGFDVPVERNPAGGHILENGSSYACPIVTGAAALMLEASGKNNSNNWIWNNDDLRSGLLFSCEDVTKKGAIGYPCSAVDSGIDSFSGAGAVRIDRLLDFGVSFYDTASLWFKLTVPSWYNAAADASMNMENVLLHLVVRSKYNSFTAKLWDSTRVTMHSSNLSSVENNNYTDYDQYASLARSIGTGDGGKVYYLEVIPDNPYYAWFYVIATVPVEEVLFPQLAYEDCIVSSPPGSYDVIEAGDNVSISPWFINNASGKAVNVTAALAKNSGNVTVTNGSVVYPDIHRNCSEHSNNPLTFSVDPSFTGTASFTVTVNYESVDGTTFTLSKTDLDFPVVDNDVYGPVVYVYQRNDAAESCAAEVIYDDDLIYLYSRHYDISGISVGSVSVQYQFDGGGYLGATNMSSGWDGNVYWRVDRFGAVSKVSATIVDYTVQASDLNPASSETSIATGTFTVQDDDLYGPEITAYNSNKPWFFDSSGDGIIVHNEGFRIRANASDSSGLNSGNPKIRWDDDGEVDSDYDVDAAMTWNAGAGCYESDTITKTVGTEMAWKIYAQDNDYDNAAAGDRAIRWSPLVKYKIGQDTYSVEPLANSPLWMSVATFSQPIIRGHFKSDVSDWTRAESSWCRIYNPTGSQVYYSSSPTLLSEYAFYDENSTPANNWSLYDPAQAGSGPGVYACEVYMETSTGGSAKAYYTFNVGYREWYVQMLEPSDGVHFKLDEGYFHVIEKMGSADTYCGSNGYQEVRLRFDGGTPGDGGSIRFGAQDCGILEDQFSIDKTKSVGAHTLSLKEDSSNGGIVNERTPADNTHTITIYYDDIWDMSQGTVTLQLYQTDTASLQITLLNTGSVVHSVSLYEYDPNNIISLSDNNPSMGVGETKVVTVTLAAPQAPGNYSAEITGIIDGGYSGSPNKKYYVNISCADNDVSAPAIDVPLLTWSDNGNSRLDQNEAVTISVCIADASGLSLKKVYYRLSGQSWNSADLGGAGDTYSANIGSFNPGELQYYITASDNDTNGGAADKMGDTMPAEGYYKREICENVPPQINWITLSNTIPIGGAPVTITTNVTDNIELASVRTDSVTLVYNGSDWQKEVYASTVLGTHTINIFARDSAGNTATAAIDYVTVIGGTIIINTNAVATNNTLVYLGILCESAAEMIVSENFDFSGASWEPYAETDTYVLSSGEGTKILYIKFKDSQDIEGGVSSDTIFLDITGPSTIASVWSTSHQVDSWSNSPSISVKWTISSDTLCGLNGYSILWDTSASAFPDTLMEVGAGDTSVASPVLSENDWLCKVVGVDMAGNAANSYALCGSFMLDLAPPQDVSLDTPSDGYSTDNNTVALSWNASADTLSGLNYYLVQLSANPSFAGVDISDSVSPSVLSWTTPALSRGSTYYWRASAVDTASNVSGSETRSFTITGASLSNGNGGGYWSDTDTWKDEVVPDSIALVSILSGDTVVFDRLDTNITCSTVTINAGGVLCFKENPDTCVMIVRGDMIVNGSLVIRSSQSVDSGILKIDCPNAHVEYGIIIGSGGEFVVQGYSNDTRNASLSANNITYRTYVRGQDGSKISIKYADIGYVGHFSSYWKRGIMGYYIDGLNPNEGYSVESSTLHHSYYPVWLSRCSDINIRGNKIHDSKDGVHIEYGSSNTISYNVIYDNSQQGISFDYSDNNTITNNVCTDNAYGIFLDSSDNNLVHSNLCNTNSFSGVFSRGTNNLITYNICYGHKSYASSSGFKLTDASENTLIGNRTSNNKYGIFLDGATGILCIGDTHGYDAASTTQDVYVEGFSACRTTFRGCVFASPVEIGTGGLSTGYAYILSQNHDQIPGLNRIWGDYFLNGSDVLKANYAEESYSGAGDTGVQKIILLGSTPVGTSITIGENGGGYLEAIGTAETPTLISNDGSGNFPVYTYGLPSNNARMTFNHVSIDDLSTDGIYFGECTDPQLSDVRFGRIVSGGTYLRADYKKTSFDSCTFTNSGTYNVKVTSGARVCLRNYTRNNTHSDEVVSGQVTWEPWVQWAGDAGYISEGVEPDTGTSGAPYVFKVTYFDSGPSLYGDPPAAVQVWIDLDDNADYSDSEKFTMSKDIGQDNDYTNGEKYAYTHNVSRAGDGTLNYRFYFGNNYSSTNGDTSAAGEPNTQHSFSLYPKPDLSIASSIVYPQVAMDGEVSTGCTFTVRTVITNSGGPDTGLGELHIDFGSTNCTVAVDQETKQFATGSVISDTITWSVYAPASPASGTISIIISTIPRIEGSQETPVISTGLNTIALIVNPAGQLSIETMVISMDSVVMNAGGWYVSVKVKNVAGGSTVTIDTDPLQTKLAFSLGGSDVSSDYSVSCSVPTVISGGGSVYCTFTILKTGSANGLIYILPRIAGFDENQRSTFAETSGYYIKVYMAQVSGGTLVYGVSGETLAELHICSGNLLEDAAVLLDNTVSDTAERSAVESVNISLRNNPSFPYVQELEATLREIRPVNVGDMVTAVGTFTGSDSYMMCRIYYRNVSVADSQSENSLRIYEWNGGQWSLVPGIQSVNTSDKFVFAQLAHLSIFRLLIGISSSAASSLSGVYVYPNPYKPAAGLLIFKKLTSVATIRIYNIAGELVCALSKDDSTDEKTWDAANNRGDKVASGVYIYLVTNPEGEKAIGKIAVIR